jgi:hypothetical protein
MHYGMPEFMCERHAITAYADRSSSFDTALASYCYAVGGELCFGIDRSELLVFHYLKISFFRPYNVGGIRPPQLVIGIGGDTLSVVGTELNSLLKPVDRTSLLPGFLFRQTCLTLESLRGHRLSASVTAELPKIFKSIVQRCRAPQPP